MKNYYDVLCSCDNYVDKMIGSVQIITNLLSTTEQK